MPHLKRINCIISIILFSSLTATTMAAPVSSTAIPLGDGKISTSPMREHVFSCESSFHGSGAQQRGEWLGASSWDKTRKIHIQGNVPWPNAQFNIQIVNGSRQITGNGLPINHPTGVFPVQASDPAYQIDRNPNRIEAQNISLTLPLTPKINVQASCVPMGMIGITTNGVVIFNALDAAGRDAVAHEVQDKCNGHPEMTGQYHYHGASPCHIEELKKNALIGYALDGFGIYSNLDENGKELTNADLDECHGRTSRVQWDGKDVVMYHYVLTKEYPYTVGCFRAQPVQYRGSFERARPNAERPGFHQPPSEAMAACAKLNVGAGCQFVTPHGHTVSGSCQSPGGNLACVPDHMPGMR